MFNELIPVLKQQKTLKIAKYMLAVKHDKEKADE